MRYLAICLLCACAGRSPSPGGGGGSAQPAPDAAPAVLVAPTPEPCVAGTDRTDFNLYDQRRALQGDNGTFTDGCDASGNLVSHQCAFQDVTCPGGGGRERHMTRPCLVLTGQVESETVSCDGQCRDGACAVRCPAAGDRMTYVALDAQGNPVFDGAAGVRGFACTMAFDQKNDTFDCASDPKVGDVFVVAGLGMSSSMCTGGVWGAVSDSHCTYSDCRFVY